MKKCVSLVLTFLFVLSCIAVAYGAEADEQKPLPQKAKVDDKELKCLQKVYAYLLALSNLSERLQMSLHAIVSSGRYSACEIWENIIPALSEEEKKSSTE